MLGFLADLPSDMLMSPFRWSLSSSAVVAHVKLSSFPLHFCMKIDATEIASFFGRTLRDHEADCLLADLFS